jgi:hypothetical protein
MKSKRARFALVSDATVGPNKVQSIRPPGVCSFGMVVESIDQGREFDAKSSNACTGHQGALLLIAGAAEQNFIANIALHLPDVRRMRFKDVDRIEIDLAFVLLRQLVQGGNLPPKGRSSVAAEDEDYGPFCPEGGQRYRRLVFELLHGQVGRCTTNAQSALSRIEPHGLEWK